MPYRKVFREFDVNTAGASLSRYILTGQKRVTSLTCLVYVLTLCVVMTEFSNLKKEHSFVTEKD